MTRKEIIIKAWMDLNIEIPFVLTRNLKIQNKV